MQPLIVRNTHTTYLRVRSPIPLKKLTPYVNQAQEGDIKAQDVVIISCIPFVIVIARKYSGCGLSIEDLISEGIVGVLNAIKHMDFRRADSFGTCAGFYIRASIHLAIENSSTTVRFSRDVYTLGRKVQECILEGRTPEEMAQKLGRTKQRIVEFLENPYWPAQCAARGESDGYKMDKITATDENAAFNALVAQETAKRLYQAIDKLPERDQWLIRGYYGLGGVKQKSQAVLAKKRNCTPQAISRRILRILERLRAMEELKNVRPE